MNTVARALLPLVFALTAAPQADAQGWPNNPIRIVVSQAAGGTPD
ncbi:MAG: hypothetical protein QOJ04_2292, partial [Caballeronia sp.]|nr:hypothetical protein [Caballeronia sp.]